MKDKKLRKYLGISNEDCFGDIYVIDNGKMDILNDLIFTANSLSRDNKELKEKVCALEQFLGVDYKGPRKALPVYTKKKG